MVLLSFRTSLLMGQRFLSASFIPFQTVFPSNVDQSAEGGVSLEYLVYSVGTRCHELRHMQRP